MYSQQSNIPNQVGLPFQQSPQLQPHPQQYSSLPPYQQRLQQQQTESYHNSNGVVIHPAHESPNKLVYQLHVDDQDIVEDDPLSCVLVPKRKDNNSNPNQHQIGGVFVGNYNAALSPAMLQTHNIRAVLTVSKETPISYQPSLVPFHLCK